MAIPASTESLYQKIMREQNEMRVQIAAVMERSVEAQAEALLEEECKPNPLKCDDAVDRGLLRPERLAKHASGASQRMREFRQRWQKIERERL